MTGGSDTPGSRSPSHTTVETGAPLRQAQAAYAAAKADPGGAGDQAAAAVAAAREAADDEALVVALRAQAWAARGVLEGDRARVLLQQAASLARRADLPLRLGETLVDRAAVAMEQGRNRAAVRDLAAARELFDGHRSVDLEHLTAVLHQNAGRLAEAEDRYRTMLAWDDLPVGFEVRAANNLGMITSRSGRHREAVELLARAARRAREAGRGIAAYVVLGEAEVLARAGRLPESVRRFEETEEFFVEAGLPLGEVHAGQTEALLELNLLPEAMQAAARAVREFAAAGMPLMEADAELQLAGATLRMGRTGAAERAAEAAAESFRQQRRPAGAAQADVLAVEARRREQRLRGTDLRRVRRAASVLEQAGLVAQAVAGHVCAGQVATERGRTGLALASFDSADRLSRREPVTVRLRGRVAAARAASLRGDRAATLRQCRDGLADLERHRDGLGSGELRARASLHGAELGRIGIGTAADGGDALRVLGWIERSRAAALVGVHAATDPHADEFDRLRALHLQLERVVVPEQRSSLDSQRLRLEQRLRRLAWQQEQAPEVHRPGTIAELRARLGERLLVEYGVTGGRVVAVALGSERARLVEVALLSVLQGEVERLEFSLRSLSMRLSSRTTAAHLDSVTTRIARLRDLLLAPLEVPAGREAVVVPTGVLHRVPWPVLHDGPVAVAPSAHFWATTHERAARASDDGAGAVLLAAGPGLSGALREVEELAGVHRAAVCLRPPESSVAAVVDALGETSTVHFACHARMRADNPVFSGLRLSDGDLTVQELEMRGVAPHRAVLAACEAGADVAVAGGGMIGFVSALIARGTAGVLASQHLAPDHATASLMSGVHRRLADGASLARALHDARRTLDLADPVDLVNACGFTVFGAA